jgi:hypothetical protein
MRRDFRNQKLENNVDSSLNVAFVSLFPLWPEREVCTTGKQKEGRTRRKFYVKSDSGHTPRPGHHPVGLATT